MSILASRSVQAFYWAHPRDQHTQSDITLHQDICSNSTLLVLVPTMRTKMCSRVDMQTHAAFAVDTDFGVYTSSSRFLNRIRTNSDRQSDRQTDLQLCDNPIPPRRGY